jgi:hypothetical protein
LPRLGLTGKMKELFGFGYQVITVIKNDPDSKNPAKTVDRMIRLA